MKWTNALQSPIISFHTNDGSLDSHFVPSEDNYLYEMLVFLLQRLHDAVLRMPDGYLTMVGERGLKVHICSQLENALVYFVIVSWELQMAEEPVELFTIVTGFILDSLVVERNSAWLSQERS